AAVAFGRDAKLIFDLVAELNGAKFAAHSVYLLHCLAKLADIKNNHQALLNAGVIEAVLGAWGDNQQYGEIACTLLERLSTVIPASLIPSLALVAEQRPQFAPKLLRIISELIQRDPGTQIDRQTIIRGVTTFSDP
ncbi:hypothetical protein BVRB_028840, partial [Beta vulgaris subsp. vulgaris]